jgi:hypothetical protein
LSALREALIQIGPYDTFVKFRPPNVLHAIQRILMSVVFDEAEAARGLLVAVEPHDKALDFTAPALK